MAQHRRAIICIRLQHIHYGINGIVPFKNNACVREYVFSYVFFIIASRSSSSAVGLRPAGGRCEGPSHLIRIHFAAQFHICLDCSWFLTFMIQMHKKPQNQLVDYYNRIGLFIIKNTRSFNFDPSGQEIFHTLVHQVTGLSSVKSLKSAVSIVRLQF